MHTFRVGSKEMGNQAKLLKIRVTLTIQRVSVTKQLVTKQVCESELSLLKSPLIPRKHENMISIDLSEDDCLKTVVVFTSHKGLQSNICH